MTGLNRHGELVEPWRRRSSAGERSREMRHIAGRRMCRLEEGGGTGEPGIDQSTAGTAGARVPVSTGLASSVIAAETVLCFFEALLVFAGALTAGTAAFDGIEAVTPVDTCGTAGTRERDVASAFAATGFRSSASGA